MLRGRIPLTAYGRAPFGRLLHEPNSRTAGALLLRMCPLSSALLLSHPRSRRSHRAHWGNRAYRPHRGDRACWSYRTYRGNRACRGHRTHRGNRTCRAHRGDRACRSHRAHRAHRSHRGDRTCRSHRPHRPHRPYRPYWTHWACRVRRHHHRSRGSTQCHQYRGRCNQFQSAAGQPAGGRTAAILTNRSMGAARLRRPRSLFRGK